MINIERRIERVREVIKTNRGVRGVVIGAGALGSALIAACSQGPSQEQISQAVNQGVKQGIAEALKPTLTPTPTFDERVATAVDAALKKAGVATVGPTATERVTVTPTPEAVGNVKTLPKPAAWDHEPTIKLVKAVSVPSWPKTVAEAAATFGVDGSTKDSKRWEPNPDGGWHLSEAQEGDDTKDALNVNPRGYEAEIYFDTDPGKNPYAMVVADIAENVPAQGMTVWPVKGTGDADNLQKKMAIPVWTDKSGKVIGQRPAEVIVPKV